MRAERRRLTLSLLLSLLLHAPLLSLTFGGQGNGLPSFALPWRERRAEATDMRVVLMPARAAATEPTGVLGASVEERLRQALIEQTVDGGLVLKPSVSIASILPRQAEVVVLKNEAEANATPTKQTEPVPEAAPTPIPAPEVIAVERSPEPTFAVPPPPPPSAPAPAPTPVIAVKPVLETVKPEPREVAEVPQKRAEPEVRTLAAEVPKPDPAQEREVEQQRQRKAEQLEAARIEAAQRDAAQRDAARRETARQEAARVETARLETQRQELARQEAARTETTRQEAIRQAAAQKEAARIQAEKDEDAKRAARREAMGRVLNEEAAKREATATAARAPSTLPYSLSTARRGRLWGRSDANAELVQYAEAWARKIQFNTPPDTIREVVKRPHTNPMVTVAIRSDGSVESVTFVVSSGVAEVDEAIRRIVQSHASYPAFTPGLAREYDVIEVRRTWHVDTAIRLY